MKLKNDIIWLDSEGATLFFGENDLALKATGPIAKELLEALESESDYLLIFKKYSKTPELIEILEVLSSCFSENSKFFDINNIGTLKFELDLRNSLELIDLAPIDDGVSESLEVYAKNYDPTAIVGMGGYDDDLPCL